jgi:hypothetical protein
MKIEKKKEWNGKAHHVLRSTHATSDLGVHASVKWCWQVRGGRGGRGDGVWSGETKAGNESEINRKKNSEENPEDKQWHSRLKGRWLVGLKARR